MGIGGGLEEEEGWSRRKPREGGALKEEVALKGRKPGLGEGEAWRRRSPGGGGLEGGGTVEE